MSEEQAKVSEDFHDCQVFKGVQCDCSGECRKLEESKKIVYCRDYSCIWNSELKDAKEVKYNRIRTLLSKEELYKGICSRPELAVIPHEYSTPFSSFSRHVELATCVMRSPRNIKGHMDFTRYSGQTLTENLKEI